MDHCPLTNLTALPGCELTVKAIPNPGADERCSDLSFSFDLRALLLKWAGHTLYIGARSSLDDRVLDVVGGTTIRRTRTAREETAERSQPERAVGREMCWRFCGALKRMTEARLAWIAAEEEDGYGTLEFAFFQTGDEEHWIWKGFKSVRCDVR
ncbi:hypothetical protein LshimejAT787_1900180 [Lyophyllum shimeji]|uniref:Uncharacterized protein n=1 Tax=Lyophyllum shimeji TaxID=47721 RepID=A0A9P3PXP4_LYOSH|nr:hypothetical protein LshimejAT787_1900180 [Lyophyllum shimeji]